jgi:AcrR family transcriptional regulator
MNIQSTMKGVPTFVTDPADTRETIMQATYLALCEHGYADLTIQRIGDEFEKSKSLLYHHYDGKDELLVDFLEFMLDRFEETIPVEEDAGADVVLEVLLDEMMATPPEGERGDFFAALVELRAQAAHDPAYRDHFTRSDQFFRQGLADLVRTGVEEGVFRDVDPEGTAAIIQTVVGGAMFQRATTNEDAGPVLADELEEYLRCRLYADEQAE